LSWKGEVEIGIGSGGIGSWNLTLALVQWKWCRLGRRGEERRGEERRGRRGLFFVLAFVQIGHFFALKIIAKTTRDTRLRLKTSKRQGKK